MKFIRYILIVVVVITATSCKKFLDKEPKDFLSDPKAFYDTEDRLNASIASVYDKMGALHGTGWLYTYGNEADEGFYARDNTMTMPAFFDFTAGHSYVAAVWRDCYDGINRANAFLENVDNNPSIPESFRNRLRGEAHFLRGYYYFLLVQFYGGVPIRTESTKDATQNLNKKRSTVAEVYELILSDMKKAETLVPTIDAIGHGGRISKSAARGLLARICLTMAGFPLKDESKYVEARDWAKMVMDDPIHGLNPDFTNIFVKYARDEYDIRESIFEVEFWGNRTDVYTETGSVGFANQPINTNPNTGNGFGGLKVTYKLWRQFASPNDMRRDWTIANFGYTTSGPNGAKSPITTASESTIYNRQVAKWRREYETLLPKAIGATPQNFPLLRYSDILLMFAEAENAVNNGPTQEAFNKINEVRRRAYGTGYRIATITKVASGSGYTATPMIVIKNSDGHEGAQAYAYATLGTGAAAGTINTVTLLSKGAFYSVTPPTVSFVSVNGVGSGATATVTMEAINPADANIPVDLGLDELSFLEIIRAERMRELSFEQMRRFDLIRWGIFGDAMREVADAMSSTPPAASNLYAAVRFQKAQNVKHILWPIPSVEIMMNLDMVQNPNW
ncbi:MAG: RagB/SusD family nutrient uptake outer membrane protein [Pedobacter sp.]|uniref:RagB/SusD family nutrient uptake outer membrane protein n=1 Tax=Pedobacter sp. TaxID=1411316 RepID=UPI003563D71D